jgi:hypothetical protein
MKPSTEAVLNLIRRYDGACPRHFANHDIYRYGARIKDLRDAGYRIGKRRCSKHHHRHVMWEYYEENE